MERQRGDYLSLDRTALAGEVDSLQIVSNGKKARSSDFVGPRRREGSEVMVFPSDSRVGGGSPARPFADPNSFSQLG